MRDKGRALSITDTNLFDSGILSWYIGNKAILIDIHEPFHPP